MGPAEPYVVVGMAGASGARFVLIILRIDRFQVTPRPLVPLVSPHFLKSILYISHPVHAAALNGRRVVRAVVLIEEAAWVYVSVSINKAEQVRRETLGTAL